MTKNSAATMSELQCLLRNSWYALEESSHSDCSGFDPREHEDLQEEIRRRKSQVFNLTQHAATPDQTAVGVREPNDKRSVQELLTFDTLPTKEEIEARAQALAEMANQSGCGAAMIGGAPYLMGALENALNTRGIIPMYSFSTRESVDVPQPDGSIKKITVFKHAGWVVC